MTETATEIGCKIDGCPNPAVKQKGIYGRLCAEHIAQKKANGHPPAELTTITATAAGTDPVLNFQAAADEVADAYYAYERARRALDEAVAELQLALERIGS